MRDLIDFIAKSLVDAPEQVEVTEFGDTEASIIKLKVSKEDLGKVIGKKGRTAKAFRTLLSAAGAKQNLRVTLEIVEPEGSRRSGGAPAEAPSEAAEAAPTGEDA